MHTDQADLVLVPTAEVAAARDLLHRDLVHHADGRRVAAQRWDATDPDRRAATLLDALGRHVAELPRTDQRLARVALAIRGHDTAWPIVCDLDALVEPLLDQPEIDLDLTLNKLLGDPHATYEASPSKLTNAQIQATVDRILALSAEVTGTPCPPTLTEDA
jgi:hypothetical protein